MLVHASPQAIAIKVLLTEKFSALEASIMMGPRTATCPTPEGTNRLTNRVSVVGMIPIDSPQLITTEAAAGEHGNTF